MVPCQNGSNTPGLDGCLDYVYFGYGLHSVRARRKASQGTVSAQILGFLLEVAHFWALSKNQRIPLHCVYFDFSSAFNICDHEILLRKIASLGLGDRVVTWCRSYLSDRSFCVRVYDSFSPPAPAPKGVPQGSRLGPLLWSIF